MIVKGFHTLQDIGNADKIESEGPIKCTTKAAWLGHGYYFWDTNIDWGHNFGQSRYGKEYIVFMADISINDQTFDLLGNVNHRIEFRALWDLLLKSGHFKQGQIITVPKLIQYMKMKIGFPYTSIRAADNPEPHSKIKYGEGRQESLSLGERVQICLINKNNLIPQSFKLIHPQQ